MGHLHTLHSHYESGSYTHSVFMNRVRNIKIRLNEEEYKYLNSKYLILPFTSFSAFLRHLIFSKHIEIKYTPSDDNLAMAISARNKQLQNLNNQISKIGININQIAKKVNSQQYVMREDMNQLLEKLDEIERTICNDLCGINSDLK